MEGMRENVIGIDFGTTYTRVGVWNNDGVKILANDRGKKSTPSYVAFTDTEILVGDAAKDQFSLNDKNTVYDAKRLIGRKLSDANVKSDAKLWPFKIAAGSDDEPKIAVTYKGENNLVSPEEISSMILGKIKETAEAFLGSPVTKAVIAVPAYFNNSQRQATKDAAEIAGLEVLRIINEPTAAAITYGLYKKDRNGNEGKNVLMFDLGGGSFDVSLVTIDGGIFLVKATAGDTRLGGEDFTERMVKHFVQEFKRKHDKDITVNPRALRKLRMKCERRKKILSSASYTDITIEYDGSILNSMITRAKFEKLNKDYFDECMNLVKRCLDDANMDREHVDEVVLIGGSTRIPRIQQLLKKFFNGKALCKSINSDEAVAYGAAVQAALLTSQANEELQNLIIKDVTSLSFGLDTPDGAMNVLIPRNTLIPSPTKRVSISFANPEGVSVGIYQGNSDRARDNKRLATIIISKSTGVEVNFDVDLDGILTFNFETNNSGQGDRIKITYDQEGTSKEETENLLVAAGIDEDETRPDRTVPKFHSSHSAEHEFRLINSKKSYICDGCKQKGCGARYSCESCYDFQLHQFCMNATGTIYHNLLGCTFNFFVRPPMEMYNSCKKKCVACGKIVEGYVYFCKEKNQFLHPCCLNLKGEIYIDGVLLSLSKKEMRNKCIWCEKRSIPKYGSRVPGWAYMCKHEEYNIHVNCVLEMALESIEHGVAMNYDESLVLQKGNKFFRTMLLICQTITGVILGDPILILGSVLDGILDDNPSNVNLLGTDNQDIPVAIGNYQVVASPEYECRIIDIPEDRGGNIKQPRGRRQFLCIRPLYSNVTLQKVITVANFVVQWFSATTEQLGLCSKFSYAMVLMILSLLSMASCICELSHRMKRQGFTWRWKGIRSWFYNLDNGLPFTNLIDICGFLTAVDEGVLSVATLIYAIRGTRNPIRINMWPLITSGILMLYSIFRVRETIALPVKRND